MGSKFSPPYEQSCGSGLTRSGSTLYKKQPDPKTILPEKPDPEKNPVEKIPDPNPTVSGSATLLTRVKNQLSSHEKMRKKNVVL